jgi:transposase-like protein
MAPRKLSESDKQEILSAYRQSSDTTTTLASRYGVSTSTISRILKQSLPEQEYEDLVQQKRSGALRGQIEQEMLPGIEPELLEEPLFDESDESVEEADLEEADLIEVEAAPKRRRTPPVSRRQRKRLDNKRSNQSLIDVQSQLEVQDLSAGDAVVSEAVERLLPDLNRKWLRLWGSSRSLPWGCQTS